MPRFIRRFLFTFLGLLKTLTVIVLLAMAWPGQAKIDHLELGAANYSAEEGTHKTRFLRLEKVVQDLIQEFGAEGTIYLNDISWDGLDMAKAHLRQWLRRQNITAIHIQTLLGDYTQIPLPQVQTAGLGNPSLDQLPERINPFLEGTEEHALWPARQSQLIHSLERIATHSQSGLVIDSYFFENMDHLSRALQTSRLILESEKTYPYYFPDGRPGQRHAKNLPKRYRLVPYAMACETHFRSL